MPGRRGSARRAAAVVEGGGEELTERRVARDQHLHRVFQVVRREGLRHRRRGHDALADGVAVPVPGMLISCCCSRTARSPWSAGTPRRHQVDPERRGRRPGLLHGPTTQSAAQLRAGFARLDDAIAAGRRARRGGRREGAGGGEGRRLGGRRHAAERCVGRGARAGGRRQRAGGVWVAVAVTVGVAVTVRVAVAVAVATGASPRSLN